MDIGLKLKEQGYIFKRENSNFLHYTLYVVFVLIFYGGLDYAKYMCAGRSKKQTYDC